jgi:hypothetical protein
MRQALIIHDFLDEQMHAPRIIPWERQNNANQDIYFTIIIAFHLSRLLCEFDSQNQVTKAI